MKTAVSKPRIQRIALGFRIWDLSVKTRISPTRISMFEREMILPRPEEARRLNAVLGLNAYPEGGDD